MSDKLKIDFNQFFLIAGPCVIENKSHSLMMAEKLLEITTELKIQFIYKSSYDKANRSSGKSFRGVGIDKGLSILQEVKNQYNIPVLTDVHSVEEISLAGEVVDILQIPAFLSRQTDLLIAAARTQKIVNIKKGQFLAPWEMKNAVEKVKNEGADQILLTERGTFFGYHNLVSDMRSIPIMKQLNCPVVFDGTHSVQQPGAKGSSSGGQREFVPILSRSALAAGADGLFWEVHDNPDQAPSDGSNMLNIVDVSRFLNQMLQVYQLCHEFKYESI